MPPADAQTGEPRNHEFQEIETPTKTSSRHLAIGDLKEARLEISAELGECAMRVRDILDLKRGSVVSLNKLAGELSEIRVNGALLARGEMVVVGDVLHVRISEIVGTGGREPDEGQGHE